MELTEEQKQEIKQQFKVRQTRQLCVSLPIAVLVVAVILFENQLPALGGPISEEALGMLFIAVILAVLVFSLKNWRCPQCDKYLGRGANPKFCAKCGVALQ